MWPSMDPQPPKAPYLHPSDEASGLCSRAQPARRRPPACRPGVSPRAGQTHCHALPPLETRGSPDAAQGSGSGTRLNGSAPYKRLRMGRAEGAAPSVNCGETRADSGSFLRPSVELSIVIRTALII